MSSSTAVVLGKRSDKMTNGETRVAYFLRLPRNTSTAPKSNTSALPAEAGLISGTGAPKAKLPVPIKSNTLPNSFAMDLLLDTLETRAIADVATATSAIRMDATSYTARPG